MARLANQMRTVALLRAGAAIAGSGEEDVDTDGAALGAGENSRVGEGRDLADKGTVAGPAVGLAVGCPSHAVVVA